MNKDYESKFTYFVLAGYFDCPVFKYWNDKRHFWENTPSKATRFYDINSVKAIAEHPTKYQPDYISNSPLRIMKIQTIETVIDILEEE